MPLGKRNKIKANEDFWHLTLYVAGATAKSLAAIDNLKNYCKKYLNQKYTIEVIDLVKNPHLAESDQILAIPTLVRKVPKPIRKIIGDLSNVDKVNVALDHNSLKKKDKL